MKVLMIILLFLSAELFADESITGTYSYSVDKNLHSVLRIKKLSDSKIQFDIDCQGGAPAFNSGYAKSIIALKDDRALYRRQRIEGETCEIEMLFSQGKVQVNQLSGHGVYCGFGMRVTCDGEFLLRSKDLPVFEN